MLRKPSTPLRPVRRRERIKGRLALALLAVSLACYLLFRVMGSFGPAVQESMEYACKGIASDAISGGIHQALEEQPDLYEGLYQLEYDSQGQVRTVTTDAARLNYVEICLGHAMNQVLQENDEINVEIPLGSLLGWRFFTGKGPNIDFAMSQSGYVLSEVESSMESTGINQTDFQVKITFTIDMVASISGYIQTVEVQETVSVVQMVLSGETPDFYSRSSG